MVRELCGVLPLMVAGDAGSPAGWDKAAVVGETHSMTQNPQHPLMRLVTPEPMEWMTGAEVMDEITDLLQRRLPMIPDDDAMLGVLRALSSVARSRPQAVRPIP